jgi:hypothetical protein
MRAGPGDAARERRSFDQARRVLGPLDWRFNDE